MNTWLNRGASGGLETEAKQPTVDSPNSLTHRNPDGPRCSFEERLGLKASSPLALLGERLDSNPASSFQHQQAHLRSKSRAAFTIGLAQPGVRCKSCSACG